MSLLSSLVGPVAGLLDKVIPDKDQAAALAHEIANVPQADTSVMMPVLMGLLGLGGLRSFEKTKGVNK
jgi:hypothetical protein